MTEEGHEEFDFSKYDKDTVAPLVLDQDMLRRRMTWNTVPCDLAVEVIKAQGLPPASDDVEEMEHQEAHARQQAILPLGHVLFQLTAYTADSIKTALDVALGAAGVPADGIMEIEQLHPLILQSVVAMLSELVDLDIVHTHMPLTITGTPDV